MSDPDGQRDGDTLEIVGDNEMPEIYDETRRVRDDA
jgi:hypothetical protein